MRRTISSRGSSRLRWGSNRSVKILAALVAAAGAAFIFHQWTGGRPFWVDEQMIALNIRDRPFAALAGPLWLGQSAPLGWLALQRAVVLIFGTSEQALRFVPACFGAATLGAAFWVGRRWMTGAGALTLVLLCTFGVWLSFYPLEMKHYSADAFWGLVLPALAVWAIEGASPIAVRRRALAWWALAAAAHWLSNGGLFATPGCALLLFVLIWRRLGAREAIVFAAGGVLWLVSFAFYYQLSLGYTHNSPYLRRFWSAELPPASIGVAGTLAWLASRLPLLAEDPGGTSMWVAFWATAVAGFVFAPRLVMGIAFATAPLTAFLLAGVVPLYQRFALWTVPALYAGVAMLADRAVMSARSADTRRWLRYGTTVAIAAAVLPLAAAIVARGVDDFRHTRVPDTNRGLDDRASTRWLLEQRRPGDAVLSTRLGWPALWWYGQMQPAASIDAGRVAGHVSHYQVDYLPSGPDCGELREAMKPHTRALVHIGFPDLPEGYGELLLRHLDQIGAIASYRQFGHVGFVAVVDLHTPGAEQRSLDLIPLPRRGPAPERLAGCIDVKPAVLW